MRTRDSEQTLLLCCQAARRKQKSIANSKVQKMRNDLMSNLMKHTAVKSVLNNRNPENKDIDETSQKTLQTQKSRTVQNMFMLPDMPSTSAIDDYITPDEFDSDSSVDTSPRKQTKWKGNIHHVDVSTGEFKSLPADVRYDILTDLKETRKQNSWGRLHEMPKVCDSIKIFQPFFKLIILSIGFP